jgi:hypothetical protein
MNERYTRPNILEGSDMWRTLSVLLSVGTLTIAGNTSAADKPQLTMAQIIENVRANELLYEGLDLSFDYSYQLSNPISVLAEKPGEQSTLKATHAVQTQTHFVSQQGMFRVDRQGELKHQDGQGSLDRLRAFDGQTTRLLDQHQIGNIIDSRSEDENCLRPHMVLLRFMNYYVPLSTYLSGHEAMAAHPGVSWQGYTLEVTYQGIAKFQSLTCHRVWISTSVSGKLWDRWELWLAEERNFIPVRNLGYTFRTSNTESVGEGRVERWKEVKPGVWFPEATRVTAWNQERMKKDGVKETQWVEKVDVKEVTLDPHYDASYFRDVKFPDGTAVYGVSAGKILGGHIEGAPQVEPPSAARTALRWWPLGMSIAILGLISAVIGFRRLRRQQVIGAD